MAARTTQTRDLSGKRKTTLENLLLIFFRCGHSGLKTVGIYGTIATLENLLAPFWPRVTPATLQQDTEAWRHYDRR